MIELRVNGEIVDLSNEVIVSYSYDLYSEDSLSAFTTSYTSNIELPMTSTNKNVFGYPSISYSTVGDYAYELYRDGVVVDAGALVVSSVTDDVINVNLFSSLVSASDQLSKIKNFGECIKKDRTNRFDVIKIVTFNDETAQYEVLNKRFSVGNVPATVSGINQDANGERLFFVDSDGRDTDSYINIGIANIGKPEALNCGSYFNGTSVYQATDGVERTFLQTMYDPNKANMSQIRVLDVQPYVPAAVLLANMFYNVNGVNISMSQNAIRVLKDYYVTMPTLRKYYDNLTFTATEVNPTSATTSATTFTGVYPVGSSLILKNTIDVDPSLWGSLSGGNNHRRLAANYVVYQVTQGATVTQYKVLYYLEGSAKYIRGCASTTLKHLWKDSTVTKVSRSDYANQPYTVLGGLVDGTAADVVVTCTGYVLLGNYSYQSNSGQAWIKNPLTVNPSWGWDVLEGTCTTSGQSSTFKVRSYLESIKDPWKLCIDLCKHFNLRFKFNNPTDIELCLGGKFWPASGSVTNPYDGEYYELNEGEAYDIGDKLDYSDYRVEPYVFTSKNVRFIPEFNDTAWDKSVANATNLNYGSDVLDTSYPVKSQEDWFSWGGLRHLSTLRYGKYILWGAPQQTQYLDKVLYNVAQAFDTDSKQVDIANSLCCVPNVAYANNDVAYICNEMQTENKCYYEQAYVMTLVGNGNAKEITRPPYITTLARKRGDAKVYDFCLFGGSVAPEGVNLFLNGFDDVKDQMHSSKLVLKVFLDTLEDNLYEFVRKIYLIDYKMYIVGAVKNYSIGSGEPCEVEFIRINDIENYATIPPTTYTVTFSCQHGSVNATVDGVRIQSGSSVEEGKTVVFTITPDEGYEYLGTNPESVVVSGNVTKSYECTELPVYHTVTFSCTNGSVGATVDGVGIQSGTQVLEGKTVVFTITPDSGYEYEGTNPESVVVDADVSKSYECTPIGEWAGLKFTANNATAKMGWKTNNALLEKTIQYSIDGGNTWISLVSSTEPTLVEFSEIRIKGDNSTYSDLVQAYWCSFTFEGSVSASGNIMSIIQSSGYKTLTSFTDIRVFRFLFWNCTTLTTAPELPATTLTENCYQCMFMGCTSLVSSPSVLPATTTTQQCYIAMFSGCTSLVSAPEIKGVILGQYCYNSMFYNCSSLHGTVIIRATSPYSSETTTACGTMFSGSGTAEGAGGIIKVGGSTADWNSTNAGIDSSIWEVELLNENE